MKQSSFKLLVASILLELSHNALAGNQAIASFKPLEELSPEVRSSLNSQIEAVEEVSPIDWENVLAGVNENGELIFIDRLNFEVNPLSAASCFGH